MPCMNHLHLQVWLLMNDEDGSFTVSCFRTVGVGAGWEATDTDETVCFGFVFGADDSHSDGCDAKKQKKGRACSLQGQQDNSPAIRRSWQKHQNSHDRSIKVLYQKGKEANKQRLLELTKDHKKQLAFMPCLNLVEGHSYDASLPIRFGGLGLYSEKLVSFYAFVASRAQSWVLQDHILRDSGICGMDDDYVSALAVS
ncbi:hypothetical protein Tco_0493526 [Tanacetum coccineum]